VTKGRTGGGTAVYVRKEYETRKIAEISINGVEMLAVYLEKLNMIVAMVYRPPPDHGTQYNGELLEKSFKKIVIDNMYEMMNYYKSPVPDIVIAGDFNFPKAVWKHGIGEAKATTRNENNSTTSN